MGNDYMQYPATVKGLAEELKLVCNDYLSKKITNDRVFEIISWYATAHADKMFSGEQINPTVSKTIGKKRVRLINDLLSNATGRA